MPILTLLFIAASLYAQRKDAAAPAFVEAETARLAFHVSPASAKVEEAVDALRKLAGKARIVKVRAFVAAGPNRDNDAGPVAGLIARRFAERHAPVPVISVIRVARFMDPAVRVALESVEEASDPRNPAGLVFISGQATQGPLGAGGASAPLAPFTEKSVSNLKAALSGLDLAPEDVLRVTCFTSSLDEGVKVHGLVAAAFIHAAIDLMQAASMPANSVVECEAVARLKVKPAEPVFLVNPTGAAFAQAVVVSTPRMLFTTVAGGSGAGDAAVREAFEGLKGVLASAGSSLDRVFYVYAYPAGAGMLQKYRDLRWDYLDKKRAPASTNLPFDGVADRNAGIGMEVIAAGRS